MSAMPKYQVVHPTAEHVEKFAAVLNEADIMEAKAMGYSTPLEVVDYSVRASRDAYCLLADGEPVAMCGIAPYGAISTTGMPWVLTSRNIKEHFRPFLRYAKFFAKEWLTQYNRLCHFIDQRHTQAMQWVEWVGFKPRGVQYLGPDNLPFVAYEMRN